MNSQRTHYVTTSDGVAIGGAVHGDGPPLVFLQGVIGDADIDWGSTAAHLTDGFTCYLPSLRGRGLSSDHHDLSTPRIIEDCLTYVESIGQPVGLVGWSGGGVWALAVAARSDAVAAVAPFEPGMLSLADESVQAVIGNAISRTAELAAAGDLSGAAKAFAGFPFSDEEIALADAAGYFDAAGRYVPSLLNLLQQAMTQEGPVPDDPAVLGAVKAPVAVLLGSDTKPFFAISARHVVDHIASARIHDMPGVGHAAPLTRPGALAQTLRDFFTASQ